MISARIHPHFQGTGFEALPLHFSKPFPWSSESAWSGLGSVKSGTFSPTPSPSSPSLHPSTFSSLYIELSVQSKAISGSCLDGILSPIKAAEHFSGPASGVCQNFNYCSLWRQLSPSWSCSAAGVTCKGPAWAGVSLWAWWLGSWLANESEA